MMRRMWFSGLSVLALAAAVAPQAALAADNGQPSTVQEIVVTANKRPQSIYKVPTSLTTVRADSLEQQGISSLTQLADVTPGLSFYSRGAPGTNQVILRGLTSGDQQTSPTVGFYVNDTPFGFSIPVGGGASLLQPDLDPSDIDHIEILRGPQGTLYGAGTLGGLIKYVTKQPDARAFSGAIQAGGEFVDHGGAGATARASLNAPLVEDKLALRVSAFSRNDPGYVDNAQTGDKDVNGVHAYGGRASLGIYPTSDLSIVLSALDQTNRDNAPASVTANPVTLVPVSGDLTQRYYFDQPYDSDYRLADAEVTWRHDGYTAVSSTSASKVNLNVAFDFTTLLPADFLGATYYEGPQSLQYEKFAQEVRLASPSGGRIEWLVGAYYTDETVDAVSSVDGKTASGGPGPYVPVISQAKTTARYEEEAAFGNLTYNFTQALGLTLGVRVANNAIHDTILSGGLLSGVPLNEPTVQLGREQQTVATYLAALNWRYAPGGSLFLRAASGYRPGGPIEPPAILPPGLVLPKQYNSDGVWDFDVGGRSTFIDGKVSAEYAAFWINWSDIQLPFLVNGFRELSNGGGAVSRGFEFDGRWKPVTGLTLGLAATYTDAQLTSPAPLVYGQKGDPLPFVPRWSVSPHIDYAHPLPGGALLQLGATYHFESGRASALSVQDPSDVRLKGFDVVDLHGGIGWDRYEVDLFLRNALDKRAYTSGGVSGGEASLVPIQPRTVGFTLNARF